MDIDHTHSICTSLRDPAAIQIPSPLAFLTYVDRYSCHAYKVWVCHINSKSLQSQFSTNPLDHSSLVLSKQLDVSQQTRQIKPSVCIIVCHFQWGRTTRRHTLKLFQRQILVQPRARCDIVHDSLAIFCMILWWIRIQCIWNLALIFKFLPKAIDKCYKLSWALGFPSDPAVKESTCNAGDLAGATGSIPGLGRSLREGNGNSLQYSFLGNPMHRVTNSQIWLSH